MARRTNGVLRMLELLVPSCDCPGGERGWNLNESPVTSGFISYAYAMKSPENPKKRGLESFWAGDLVVVLESGVPGRAWKRLTLSLYFALYTLLSGCS